MTGRLFEHVSLTIGGIEYQPYDGEPRITTPTAYAPAVVTRSQATGIDDPDPARFTVDVTVPAANTDGELLRTNLHPNPRYIGPDGTTGGGSSSWAQQDLTSGAPDGRGYTRFTVDADATGTVEIGMDAGAYVPVTPGETYTGSFYHRQTRAGGTQIILSWLDSSGAQIGRTFGSPLDPTPGVWVRHHVTATAPAGAAELAVRWYVPRSVALAGDTLDVAQRMIELSAILTPYFDGGTPDTTGRLYYWSGTANASPSWEYGRPVVPQIGDDVEAIIRVVEDPNDVNVFTGRVESLRRTRRPVTTRTGDVVEMVVYQIDAADDLAPLSRRTIGDTPWPAESLLTRWARFSTLLPDFPIPTEPLDAPTNAMCAPRDVDNVSALQVMRDTVAVADMVVTPWPDSPSGIRIDAASRANWIQEPGEFNTVTLPGDAFADPADVLDYDLVVNVARVNGKVLDNGEYRDSTITFTNSVSRDRYGESAVSVSGDGLPDSDGTTLVDTAAADRARQIVQDARNPRWRLDGPVSSVRHVLAGYLQPGSDVPSSLHSLITPGPPAFGPLVEFTGLPSYRESVWRPISIRIAWGGTEHDALELEVEPYQMAAPSPA